MSVTLVDGDLPEEVGQLIRASRRVAVDTETSGLDWSSDSLHLCQLFTDTAGAFLIRNVGAFPKVLASVLCDPSILKVFHFAPFDLRFLRSQWQVEVENIECTKAASRLLDPALPSPSHSLQALLDRHLAVQIEKGKVRTSDWSAPDLSAEQIEYAAQDVAYLLDLSDTLRLKLDQHGRLEMFRRVCGYMPTAAELEILGVPDPLRY